MTINRKISISALLIVVLTLGVLGTSVHAVYSVRKQLTMQVNLSQHRGHWAEIQATAWQLLVYYPPGEQLLREWDELLRSVNNREWYTDDIVHVVLQIDNAISTTEADLEAAVTQAFAITPPEFQSLPVEINFNMLIFLWLTLAAVWLLQFIWMKSVGNRMSEFTDDQPPVKGNDELTIAARQLHQCIFAINKQIRAANTLMQQITAQPEIADNSGSRHGFEMVEDNSTELSKGISATTTTVADSIQEISGVITELHEHMRQQQREVEMSEQDHSKMFGEIQRASHESISIDQKLQEVQRLLQNGNAAVVHTVEEMRSVERDIRGILEVIPIINTIAERTSLLSMNASIESAHAGADGLGFAVVAEEIGKLAAESSQNAESIAESLHLTVSRVQHALAASERSTEIFDAMRTAVYDYSQTITEINTSLGELTIGMREIQNAIQEILEATAIVEKLTSTMQVTSQALAQHLQRASMESMHTTVVEASEKAALCSAQHDELITAIDASQLVRTRLITEYQKNTTNNG